MTYHFNNLVSFGFPSSYSNIHSSISVGTPGHDGAGAYPSYLRWATPWTKCCGEEKAKLQCEVLMYRSGRFPTLTYGHELWVEPLLFGVERSQL